MEEAGGDPSGWPVPEWTPADSEASLIRNGAKTAILSLTAPGAPIAGDGQAGRELARHANEYCAKLRDKNPQQWGFWAALPSLLDTEGALEEIAYALDVLKADGVTVFTRYGKGNTYLGHPDLKPIWAELNARSAVVFVHPTHPVDTNKVNPMVMQPSIDYPHETTRAAVDMLTRGTMRENRNCKVILSHAGGTLPWIVSRLFTQLKGVARENTPRGMTYEDAMGDFRSFYFDLALSSAPQVLALLLQMVDHDHILYGKCDKYVS